MKVLHPLEIPGNLPKELKYAVNWQLHILYYTLIAVYHKSSALLFVPFYTLVLLCLSFKEEYEDYLNFYLQMSDVKRLSERLECMLFRARFSEEVDELKPVRKRKFSCTCSFKNCKCVFEVLHRMFDQIIG